MFVEKFGNTDPRQRFYRGTCPDCGSQLIATKEELRASQWEESSQPSHTPSLFMHGKCPLCHDVDVSFRK